MYKRQDRKHAFKLRESGFPFKINDVHSLKRARIKWDREYISKNVNGKAYLVEYSADQHFKYWQVEGRNVSKTFIPPTKVLNMGFDEWYKKSQDQEQDLTCGSGTSSGYYYFHINSMRVLGGRSEHFISRDLPFFSARRKNLFISDIYSNKGIECRFGMRGIIAEPHCDTSRNMIAVVTGKRRVILVPPYYCSYLQICSDVKDPFYRQSKIDWSNLEHVVTYKFKYVRAVQTILEAGEVLYVPPLWFHYIISLEYSLQCNAFSHRIHDISRITNDSCILDIYDHKRRGAVEFHEQFSPSA